MTPRVCPACEGSRDLAFTEEARDPVAGGVHRLYRCGSCSLVFADPRDPADEAWHAKAAARPVPPAPFPFRISKAPPGGRLLFIGAEDAFPAWATERGWTGVALRASGLAAGLKSVPAKEFDAVLLSDALDRVPEPREFLSRLKTVLKRGGRLLATLPNESRPRFLGREEDDAPPRRFTRWNERSLRAFLQTEGFAVESLAAPGPSAGWLSRRLFAGVIAPALSAAGRRVLFGPDARGRLADLYAAGAAVDSAAPPDGLKGFFADSRHRLSLERAAELLFKLVTVPASVVLSFVFGLLRGRGEVLSVSARYDG